MPLPNIPSPAPVLTSTSKGDGLVANKQLLVWDSRESRALPIPRSTTDVAIGYDLFVGIWGTSSDRRCSTTDINLLTEISSTSGTVEYTDGWYRHMLSKYNAQFSLAWNGAVAGALWADTALKITNDLALSSMPHIDIAFIRPGPNDIGAGTAVSTLTASIRNIVENQLLARGIKVVLITSHTQNPLSNIAYLTQYDAMASFCDSLAEEYKGLVLHANVYAHFGVGSQTPLSYMEDSQHMNESGVASSVGAFEHIVYALGRPANTLDPYDFGEVIMEIDPNATSTLTQTTGSFTTGTADANKQKRLLLTNTGNGGRILQNNLLTGKTLAAGDLCRLWCDVTPNAGSSTSAIYMAGAGLRTTTSTANSKRFGTYSSGVDRGPLNGNQIRGLSRIFTIPASIAADPQLYATAGAGTNSAQVGRCALIRVKKAVSLERSIDGSYVLANAPVSSPEKARDPGSDLLFPDPRRPTAVQATLIRGSVNVPLMDVDELFVIGSNSNTTSNAVSTSFMDGTVTLSVLTDGAALATATKAIHNPPGDVAVVTANTNATGISVSLGRG